MANCPHCNYKLKLIDIKAECPVCGTNIPNYRWEERLDEDAVNAEKAFAGFNRKTKAVKNALFGTKQRIARFVLTFAPLLFFLFPMFTIETQLPFSNGRESLSMLSLILDIVNGKLDIMAHLNLISLPESGNAFIVLYVALILVLLGIVAGVLNFFVIILSSFGYHAKGNVVLCYMSLVTFAAAAVCIVISGSMIASSIPEIMNIKLSYSLFVGMFFFIINIVMNTIALKEFIPLRKELLTQELNDTKKYQEELKKL
ncbi:MAG: hypothetical protein IKW03_03495 [Clostridia bacterium]|nr:hypothetical protein [Clostridia bacterium]